MRELLLMILYMKLVIVKYLNFSYINSFPWPIGAMLVREF